MFAFIGISDASDQRVIRQSRVNCVKVLVNTSTTAGTGFFLDERHVATCFHVIAEIKVTNQTPQPNIDFKMRSDLFVETQEGERLQAACISIPNQQDITPLLRDFAVLRLMKAPRTKIEPNPLHDWTPPPSVGDLVYFSGYPLSAPTMLTHQGMISGIAKDRHLICIQAAINKGNSGSALLDGKGNILGIVNRREGGITKDLAELRESITKTEKHGRVTLMGVDPLQSSKEIVNVLNRHISTGIGYAVKITFLKDYLNKHGILNQQN